MLIKNKGGLKLSSYIHFTEEERERARTTDIVELLKSQGETLKRSGSEYEWLDGTQKVTIRGNLWFHQYERLISMTRNTVFIKTNEHRIVII